ncbi:hypothetical protein WME90_04215 [Sorangium sp. So ce375]|uniref:hypothetical protein n=1 Tax=Sorangium sp. So ce375 TaxID=3133306 RepID=UPI003F5C6078
MFADPKKVGLRRLKRRLKAGASIAIAMAAGVFLACKGGASDPGASPSGPDARTGPERKGAAGGSSGQGAPAPTSGAVSDGASDAGDDLDATAPADADAGQAILVRDADASADAGASGAMVVPSAKPSTGVKPRTPHVDKEEHRKGMPVRDNLLE